LKPATIIKLAIVAMLALLFGGLALRAAMRLVSTATHSLFFGLLLLVFVVWIYATRKREGSDK
jgi:heme A synthase